MMEENGRIQRKNFAHHKSYMDRLRIEKALRGYKPEATNRLSHGTAYNGQMNSLKLVEISTFLFEIFSVYLKVIKTKTTI